MFAASHFLISIRYHVINVIDRIYYQIVIVWEEICLVFY